LKLTLLLDQNVPRQVGEFLRRRRPEWRVFHAGEVGLSGAPDERVFQWAQQERAIVITFDEDFADARTYPLGSHAGVIRLRVWPTTIEQTQEALERLLTTVPDEDLPGSLVIIDRERIRVRRFRAGT
jgi:predicted nuclease of predicted toxin-antitoxin system